MKKSENNRRSEVIVLKTNNFSMGGVTLKLTIFAMFVVALLAWLVPKQVADLFVALAGGRDVMEGLLGTPDNWSFTTSGRVWLNQNWGADLIIYNAYKLLGNFGILTLKFVLISACAIFSILSALKRRVPLVPSIILTQLAILSVVGFLEMRPNLFTSAMSTLVLWLLFMTRERNSFIWVVAAAITLWANLHGGFIFGIGMVCLFSACVLMTDVFTNGIKSLINKWQLLVGTIASIVLPGILNPFGFDNLIHPFTMMSSNVWKSVWEWLPLLANTKSVVVWGFILYFLVMLACFAIPLTKETAKNSKKQKKLNTNGNTDLDLFEVLLIIISVIMALSSTRFIVLAALVSVPMFSRKIWLLLNTIRSQAVIITINVVVLTISVIFFISLVVPVYNNVAQRINNSTLYDKIHITNEYPHKLVEFINEKKIKGNTLCDWRWEGFFRWHSPQLKLFCGARAQQIYDVETFRQYVSMIGQQKITSEILSKHDIHIIILPKTVENKNIILLLGEMKNWTKVYDDGSYILATDSKSDNVE